MAVSQKQIAERLGVSIALVSRVLSGKAAEIGITAETIKRVQQAAEEMGYVPSAAALILKGKPTRTIGVAVSDFNDPFFGSLIKEIQTQAHEHNYSLVLAGFLNRTPDEQDLQSLHKHAIDGLLVLGSDTDAQWLNTFTPLPVARIGHAPSTESSAQVAIDEDHAARQLIEHLGSKGRTSLICISRSLPAHRYRLAALEKAATAADIVLTSMVSGEKDPFEAGRQAAQTVLKKGTKPDALVCATDLIAMGALHALSDAHIGIPGQIAVTGFDDIPVAAQFIPPITTIRQPLTAMVEQAFAAVTGPGVSKKILLPGELISRQTA